jgi:hypothetical protein
MGKENKLNTDDSGENFVLRNFGHVQYSPCATK